MDRMEIVDDDVDRPHQIEGDDEQPEERTYLSREQHKDGEQSGREIAISSQRREACGQVGTDNARKDEDEPEEAKAV